MYKAARQSLLKLRTPVTKALSLVLAPVKTREASLRLHTIKVEKWLTKPARQRQSFVSLRLSANVVLPPASPEATHGSKGLMCRSTQPFLLLIQNPLSGHAPLEHSNAGWAQTTRAEQRSRRSSPRHPALTVTPSPENTALYCLPFRKMWK